MTNEAMEVVEQDDIDWTRQLHCAGPYGAAPHVLASALLHASFGLFAITAPVDPRGQPEDPVAAMRPYLIALEQRARAQDRTVPGDQAEGSGRAVNDEEGNGRAAAGERHASPEGSTGSLLSQKAPPRRWSVPRRDDGAKAEGDERARDARWFGMLGLLASQTPMPITSAGERSFEASADPIAARGAMWAPVLGDALGNEGAGLSGTGLGGGGKGAGVGLDHVGDLGHARGPEGSGTGGEGTLLVDDGEGVSWGVIWGSSWDRFGRAGWGSRSSHGGGYARLAGHHAVRSPRWDEEGIAVIGRLPPEAIQAAVRQNFGRFRLCYEQGLQKNPQLHGRVATRFVIGRDGQVVSAVNAGSDLPDANVVDCVTRAFPSVGFPAPSGDAQVVVVYPIQFLPE
jgi:hypothetical protein